MTIHEHLDHTISIRFGPHLVGRFAPNGTILDENKKRRGKDGAMSSLEISPEQRDFHFPTATTATMPKGKKEKNQAA